MRRTFGFWSNFHITNDITYVGRIKQKVYFWNNIPKIREINTYEIPNFLMIVYNEKIHPIGI